jgi:dihydrofolate reductase
MGAIRVHEFMTLDGIVESPAWTFDFGFDPAMGETIAALTGSSEAILLGRTTYEMFAPVWSTRSAADDPGAPFFNETPKHVVSSTLKSAEWSGSSVLGPYDPAAIRRLKDDADGDIYVSGSITLVRAMLADGLVDGLHLFVYPLTRPGNLRLFADDTAPAKLSLVASATYDNGVVYLGYRPEG